MTRESLILSAMPMAKHQAFVISEKLRIRRYLDDLIAVGYCTLCKVVDRYDASRGVQFATFAAFGVRGAMIDFVRELNQSRQYTRRGQTSPIPASLNWEEGKTAWTLPAPPLAQTEAEQIDAVNTLTRGLTPSMRRMFIDHFVGGKTHAQIAEASGLHPSRIGQLFQQARRELRVIHAGMSS